jgi:hypothetical protein
MAVFKQVVFRCPLLAEVIGFQVPFANHAGYVARLSKAIRERYLLKRQWRVRYMVETEALLVSACQQSRAGGRALW